MLDIILEDLEYILDSIQIISDRINKIKNAQDLVISPDGVTILDSIAMRLQSIGETVKQIDKRDKSLLQKYPETSWQQIIKMRDQISHHYDEIDNVVVYEICINKLPALKTTVQKIIKDLNNN